MKKTNVKKSFYNKNHIYVTNSLITNFKPKLKNFSNLNIVKSKNQIFCKNFFLFLLLLKYNQNNNKCFTKSTIFVKPFIRKVFTLLRAPYRHKLSRHQMILNRYSIISSIRLNSNKVKIKSFKNIISILKKIEEMNSWFESNIISNHRFKFSFVFSYKNNFLINKFNLSKNYTVKK